MYVYVEKHTQIRLKMTYQCARDDTIELEKMKVGVVSQYGRGHSYPYPSFDSSL